MQHNQVFSGKVPNDMGLKARKPNLLYVSKKDTGQPAHPHGLISAFVINYLEGIVVKLAPCKILIF